MDEGVYSIDVLQRDGSVSSHGIMGPASLKVEQIVEYLRGSFGMGDLCLDREGRRFKLVPDKVVPSGSYIYSLYVNFKDNVTDEVMGIIKACPVFKIPDGQERNLPAMDVEAYLMDHDSVRLPGCDFFSNSSLRTAIAHAVQNAPCSGRGEIVTHIEMERFTFPWDILRTHAPADKKLHFDIGLDDVAEATTSSDRALRPGLRADNSMAVGGICRFTGEHKESFVVSDKLASHVSYRYPKLDAVISYTLGHKTFQLYLQRLASKTREPICGELNLNIPAHRVALVKIFVKLYFILLSFQKIDETDTRRLYIPSTSYNRSYRGIVRVGDFEAEKKVRKWDAYCKRYGVDFQTVQFAYTCATASGGHLPKGSPVLVRENTEYQVAVRPVGLLVREELFQSEDDVRVLALHILRALTALHDKELVHRDLRLPNVVYDISTSKLVLIDLEHVARAGRQPRKMLSDWTVSTLKDGLYTTASDLHQLGFLLHYLVLRRVRNSSQLFQEFFDGCVDAPGHTTARDLLAHRWLVACPEVFPKERYPFEISD